MDKALQELCDRLAAAYEADDARKIVRTEMELAREAMRLCGYVWQRDRYVKTAIGAESP